MRYILVLSLLTGLLIAKETKPDKRLRNAATALSAVMTSPDKGIPRDLLDKAQCVVIVPGLKKGALALAGSMVVDSPPVGSAHMVGAVPQPSRLKAEVSDYNSAVLQET